MNNRPSFFSMEEDRFKSIIAFLIAVVTLFAAVVAFLQSDASARDDTANRDTKRYAVEGFGREVSGDARVNYDYNVAYQAWYELDLLATSAENREDEVGRDRYLALRDRMTALSPMLAAPYFDPETGALDLSRYEADLYLNEITTLEANFLAASAVKDAWDAKSNTYIVHLTLLAVSLFLFGLSITIATPATRWIFAGMGSAITAVAVVWAASVWTAPVYDLRAQSGAIEAYAQGVGLAYQERWEEAVASFNEAVRVAPTYANALVGRAEAHTALGNYEGAVADYEQARALGNSSANVAGDLAWNYYLLGRFDQAVAMSRTAVEMLPDELWLRGMLAVSLLASGQVDAARAEYDSLMKLATDEVSRARAAGAEPSSLLWWGLDSTAADLDGILYTYETGEGEPTRDRLADVAVVQPAAQELFRELKSLAVALEFTGEPPAAPLTAQISPFEFGAPIYDDEGNVEAIELADEFAAGTDEVAIQFDYAGMRDGQEVIFKVYIDEEEDPSWRTVDAWDLGESGSAQKDLSLSYSDVFILDPGEYVIEMYVDAQLAQRGSFYVEEE